MALTVAISGDSIINRRISTSRRDGFHELVDEFRKADVGFTHLETVFHEFDDDDAYPAAEAGGTWMAAPTHIADELTWAGIDLVSHASNHALDYTYEGLEQTWDALDRVGIPHAGTGYNLGDARNPAYLEIQEGRIGLVSMTSSFPRWSRAGEPRRDVKGRPGVNPLRYDHIVDKTILDTIKTAAKHMGWWVMDAGDGEWEINPPGQHNSRYLFRVADSEDTVLPDDREAALVPNERDLTANRRSIEDASNRADFVIGHLHTHEFRPGGDIGDTPQFVRTVARSCVDAGADIFVVQGTHSPMRGIELYNETPIFYDPGDFFRMNDTVARLPAEFYYQFEDSLSVHPADAMPSEGFSARKAGSGPGADTPWLNVENPPDGAMVGSVVGNILPVCMFDGDHLSRIDIHPGTWPDDPSANDVGIPVRATGKTAETIIADIAEKSEQYGTDIRFEDDVGVITMS